MLPVLRLALILLSGLKGSFAIPQTEHWSQNVASAGRGNGHGKSGKVPMIVTKNSLYINVSIGSPASAPIAMVVDTGKMRYLRWISLHPSVDSQIRNFLVCLAGSPLTWVTGRHYRPRDSLTAQKTPQHYNFSYLDSSFAIGDIYRDIVHCAGLSVPMQPFGYGSFSDRGNEAIEGLLGLGLPTDVNGCDGCKELTLVKNMVNLEVVSHDLVAFDAASRDPALYFGINPPDAEGRRVHFIDVLTDQGSWDVPASSINGFDTGRMTIDSGAGLILTSLPSLKDICQSVGGFVWNTGDGGYLSCNVTSAWLARLRPLQVTIGKHFEVSLKPRDIYDGNNLLVFA